jgi:hypothetical protein
MVESVDERINRRSFLKYGAAAAAVAAAGAAGYYLLTREQPVNPPTTNTTSNPPITSQSSSPLASYAKDKGLSKGIIAVLDVKLGGEATKNNKSFVDYLYGVSQADVVSPEVLQFAPEEYKPSVVESLQFKAIGDVIKENKVSDQAVKSLGYLSGFPGAVQRNTIEFGLDDTTLEFLGLTAGLPDQEFAKYAVEWRVPIQDHKLTDLKRKFLQEPGNYAKDLFGEYIAEMMSAGNVYNDLAKEWNKLPESKKIDLAAVDTTGDFNDLFLNATNPEVKEAGELILKGGTPNPKDFKYSVSNWNTELQILNQLGRQNWFRRDDTLALADSMVNGLWATMGTDEVRQTVYKDVNDLLNFGRETSEMQRALGLSYNLEDNPLEAKVCWAWIGGVSAHPALNSLHNIIYEYRDRGKVLDLNAYKWNTVDTGQLKKLRTIAENNKWINKAITQTFEGIDSFFLNNWDIIDPNEILKKMGEQSRRTVDVVGNVDIYLEHFLANGRQVGNCADQMAFVDAWCKSLGITTDYTWRNNIRLVQEGISPNGHMFNCYFNSQDDSWDIFMSQLYQWSKGEKQGDPNTFYIFKIPVNHKLQQYSDEIKLYSTKYFLGSEIVKISDLEKLFNKGIPAPKMKAYLLSS